MESMMNTPLTLPCGAVIKNRFAKSAMSENMAKNHAPNSYYNNLYEIWANGGLAISITGNVMVDSTALGEPNNVVIDKKYHDKDALKAWAKAGTHNGTHLWMQLNHPGKQSPAYLSPEPVAPSSIAYKSTLNKFFNRPRELKHEEILEIIKSFAYAAGVAKECGFTGVQIHAAHGYLIGQFLSPLHNQRNDEWGGSLENRMRFLIEIYKSIREIVGPEFPIGVKINSADFQRGGFSEEEAIEVLKVLDSLKIDLIEISGGTYEASAMMGSQKKKSTVEREAYFLDFAKAAKHLLKTPLMLTGGLRSTKVIEAALSSGAFDVIGMARPLVIDPNLPKKLINHEVESSPVKLLTSGIKTIDKIVPLEIIYYSNIMKEMGKKKTTYTLPAVLSVALKYVSSFLWINLKNRMRNALTH